MSAQANTITPRRPLLRYHGGKWRLGPWIISQFPAHKMYTEAYGGGGSVLLRKPRAPVEVYNDLDGEVVNIFRILRNPAQARELLRLLRLTPYARAEYDESWLTDGDPVEQARRTLVRSWMSFSTSGTSGQWRSGFRAISNYARGQTPADDWAGLPGAMEAVVERLRGVTIEQLPALDMLRKYDTPATLHYVDPPYVAASRGERWGQSRKGYRYEMSDDDHHELAACLHELQGAVVLSGYPSDLYAELYADWPQVIKAARADGGFERTEVLWLKPGHAQPQLPLLEVD